MTASGEAFSTAENDEFKAELDLNRLRARYAALEAHARWLESELSAMTASRAWRAAQMTSRAAKALAPRGSLRRRIAGGVYRTARGLLALLRTEGRRAALHRLRRATLATPAGPTLQRLYRQVKAAKHNLALLADLPVIPQTAKPAISIVIPVYNHISTTIACLKSIVAQTNGPAYEVVVIDDCSKMFTRLVLGRVRGLRLFRNTENSGFILSSNRGARESRGEMLVFLNNDTEVTPGWLSALSETFQTHEHVGLVGAKLVYPNGLLQEAGGAIWRDADGWNYGNRRDPDHPLHNFAREADYCSGACIMIPRELFESLGGFDLKYKPAYYEDADLAFKVRALGKKVIYQPLARVIHHEGMTSGTDLTSGVKSYQVVNQKTFAEAWRERLVHHPSTPRSLVRLVTDNYPRTEPIAQVLIIDHKLPTPDRDAGSLRMLHIVKEIRARGRHVAFIGADLAADQPYADDLRRLGIETAHSPYYESVEAYLRDHGWEFQLVIVSRADVAADCLGAIRRYAPAAVAVFDTVDLYHVREARAAETLGDANLKLAAQRRKLQELSLVRRADATLVVSPVEKITLERECPGAEIRIVPTIVEIPPGDWPGFDARKDILFLGNYEHYPNIDAVLYFVAEVLPKLEDRLPGAVFHVVGSNPPDRLKLLESPRVRISGYAPDLTEILRSTRVAVAPLRFGAGVKGKVNLALAHGLPNVLSEIAAEGMHLEHRESAMIAQGADEFASALVELYSDRELWTRVSAGGRANVERHFSVEAAGRDVDALLRFAAELSDKRRAGVRSDCA